MGRTRKGAFQLYHVAYDGNYFGRSVFLADGQAHFGAFFSTYQANHFVDAHAHDVYRFFRGLGHLEQLVTFFQFALAPRSAAGYNAGNGDILAFLLQLGTNALQLARHFNFEIFFGAGRKVLGMGIKGQREGIHVDAKPLGAVHVFQVAEPFVVHFQFLLPRAGFGSGKCFGSRNHGYTGVRVGHAVYHACGHAKGEVPAPVVFHFLFGCGVGALFGVGLVHVTGLGGHGLCQDASVTRLGLGHPLGEQGIRLVKKHRGTGFDLIVQTLAVCLQSGDIGLGEKALVPVHAFQEGIKSHFAQPVVNGLGLVVGLPQGVGHQFKHRGIPGGVGLDGLKSRYGNSHQNQGG